jgi:cell division protein FtsL
MTATLPARRPTRERDGDLRPLRVITPPARHRVRRRVLGAVLAVVVSGVLFAVVAVHVLLTEGQLKLDRLEATAVEEQERYERLRLKVAELESPARVTAVAQRRLGMVPPPGVTYLSPSGATADPLGSAQPGSEAGTSWPVVKARLAGR